MKFAIACAVSAFAAGATNLSADQSQQYGASGNAGKPGFDIGSDYKEPDYSKAPPENLPGADFNKQVHDFNEDKEIWDQNDYQERVKMEAEIMVALEALKTAVSYASYDMRDIGTVIQHTRREIDNQPNDIYEKIQDNHQTLADALANTNWCQDKCQWAE